MAVGVTVEELYAVGASLPESVPTSASAALEAYRDSLRKDVKDGHEDCAESLKLLPSLDDWWERVQRECEGNPVFFKQLEDFGHTGRSNGRALVYARMCIAEHKSFVLHAHPNLEIIYVVRGILHERRLKAEFMPDNQEFQKHYHTDLSSLPPEAFESHVHEQGQVLLNEIGSVHRSYTEAGHGVELFILWGADGHCDVPVEYTPESERLPDQVPPNKKSNQETSDTSCSAWIANALVDAGVAVVYGGHGGALAPLVNAVVDRQPELHWVCCRNEANAALMAAAHAKYTGQLACVIATSGPGATNLVTGLMESTLDQVPVLCLTGTKPRQGMHYSEFQDVEQSRLFSAGGLMFSHDVPSPEALIPLLRDAVAVATTRNTCAHLAIPVDIQATQCPIDVHRHFCAAGANARIAPLPWDGKDIARDAMLERAVDFLVAVDTKKILIAIGLRAVHAGREILKLAELLRAPIVTRLDAKGTVDESHPLVLGVEGVHGKPGMETSALLMETADLVLNFGVDDCSLLVCSNAGLQIREMMEFQTTALQVSTRFRAVETFIGDIATMASALRDALEQRGGRRFSNISALRLSIRIEKHRVSSTIQSTSPGRRISSTSMAEEEDDNDDFLLAAQVGATTDMVAGGMPSHRAKVAAQLWHVLHSGAWCGKYHHLDSMEHSIYWRNKNTAGDTAHSYPHPAIVLMEVSRHLTKETVVCIDTGDVTLWSGLCLKLKEESRTLTSEHLGTMGYGLCAGIASIMARKAPATSLVLAGDGGFQMTLQELATFQQNKRPGDKLIVIVLDNQLLGRVIFGFDGAKGCEILGPDFAALAKAYGGQGHRLNDAVQIGEHVRDAEEGLTILHVPIDPTLKADMATFHDNAAKMMNSG